MSSSGAIAVVASALLLVCLGGSAAAAAFGSPVPTRPSVELVGDKANPLPECRKDRYFEYDADMPDPIERLESAAKRCAAASPNGVHARMVKTGMYTA